MNDELKKQAVLEIQAAILVALDAKASIERGDGKLAYPKLSMAIDALQAARLYVAPKKGEAS